MGTFNRKNGVTARNRPHIFGLNRGKPEPEKTGAFQPEPSQNFRLNRKNRPENRVPIPDSDTKFSNYNKCSYLKY